MDYGLTTLEGGFSGETFLAEAAGERTVVRIYAHRGQQRGPESVEIDAAVLRLVRGLLPVPEVLEVRPPDPDAGTPAVLVTSYLPGERLDLLLPTLDEQARRTVGARMGAVLGRLCQMPFLRQGPFVDRELRIGPFPPELMDLPSFVAGQRTGTALERWSREDLDALADVAESAQRLLDGTGSAAPAPRDRACLVHSDFNPKNVLVDPSTLTVTGVLDWEFAYAGTPVTDLGNLLRFDREPTWVAGVLGGYRESVRGPDGVVGPSDGLVPEPDELLGQARAADLYALVELAGRRGENPVADAADHLLRAIARTGDLHAEPQGALPR